MQRPSFCYTGSLAALRAAVGALFQLTPLPSAEAACASAVAPAASAAASTAGAAASAADAAPTDGAAEASAPSEVALTRWRVQDEILLCHDPAAEQVELSWAAGPLADMVADAVAAVLLQLQSRLLGEAGASAAASAGTSGAVDGGVSGADSQSPADTRGADRAASVSTSTHVRRVLEEHFGALKRAADNEVLSEGVEDAACERWKLTASGHDVMLHEVAGAWEVACEDEQAAARVRRLVDLAQRSCPTG